MAVAIGDGHQIHQRVERVVQLAPRAEHRVEQQHVFYGARQLPAHFRRTVEQLELATRLEAHVVNHQGPERAAPSLQGNREQTGRGTLTRAAMRLQFGTLAAQPDSRGLEGIAGRHAPLLRHVHHIGRRGEKHDARAAIVQPDRGAVGAEQPARSGAQRFESRRHVEAGGNRARELLH